jgi:hypothetical protein
MKTHFRLRNHLLFLRGIFFALLIALSLNTYAQCDSCSYEIEQDPACCPQTTCADDGWVRGHWDEFGSWSPGNWSPQCPGAYSEVSCQGCNYPTVEEWNGGRNWDTRTADDRFGRLEIN